MKKWLQLTTIVRLALWPFAPTTPVGATECVTIASGSFADVNVWDCGCDPSSCDTLTIQHVLTATQQLTLTNALIHITSAGTISSTDDISIFGKVVNEGTVDALLLYQTQLSPVFLNLGFVHVEEGRFWGDTLRNHGRIEVVGMLQTREWTRLVNHGRVDGHYLEASVLYNYDTLSFDSAALFAAQVNEGHAMFSGSVIVWGDWLNEAGGILEADTVTIWNGLDNYGDVFAHRLIQFGNDSVAGIAMDDFPATARIECGSFKNHAHIMGSGTICVMDSSINYSTGSISGTLDICDASLSTTSPPFIDLNLGTVSSEVGWCGGTACFTGWRDVRAVDLQVFPVPSVDGVFVRTGVNMPIGHARMIGISGAVNEVAIASPGGPLRILRGPLPAGLYQLELLGQDGRRLGFARVLFADP